MKTPHLVRQGALLLLILGASWSALAADQKAAALAEVNQTRQSVGLPAVTRNAQLDQAAQAHADYLQTNSNGISHDEAQFLPNSTDPAPGFTGVGPGNRLTAAGYTYSRMNEVISGGVTMGQQAVQGLVQAIYHRFGILATAVAEVGIGQGNATGKYANFVMDFGATFGNAVTMPTGWLGTYPVNGQTGVVRSFDSDTESPDPVATQNRVGYPVSIHADDNDTLTVGSFTLTPAAGGMPLPAKLLSFPADAHVPPSAAAIVPLTVLDYGTQYRADFSGTRNGQAVSQSWTFTTAAYSTIQIDLPFQRVGSTQVARVQVSGGNGGNRLAGRSLSSSGSTDPAPQVTEVVPGVYEVTVAAAADVTLSFTDDDGQTRDAKISFADPITETTALAKGWNLLGNPLQTPMVMLERFGNADAPVADVTSNVVSVWKWLPASAQWAFYAPSMTAQALATYAAGKDYAVLDRIEPGEGYWINVPQVTLTFQPRTGVPSPTLPQSLPIGWSLLGVGGEAVTPAAFDKALPVGAFSGHSLCLTECWNVSNGLAATPSIKTLWSWDAAANQWRFFAPSLALQGNTVLSDYATGKGYAPYDLQEYLYLHVGEGFWVNK
ncbi:MAG: CAP domain-containing protein [Rhodoferax sp.]|nr:CAP domain-containing protein [Rhodoferax sp.]